MNDNDNDTILSHWKPMPGATAARYSPSGAAIVRAERDGGWYVRTPDGHTLTGKATDQDTACRDAEAEARRLGYTLADQSDLAWERHEVYDTPWRDVGACPPQISVALGVPVPLTWLAAVERIGVLVRQAEDARAMHLAAIATFTALIEALAPLVSLDPEGDVGEWAEKIRQRAAEWGALQDRATELQLKLDLLAGRAEFTALRMPVLTDTHSAYTGDPLVYIGAVAGALAAERNQAREDLADERACADNLRRTLALVSGAPRLMDATWDELVKHVSDLRPPTDPPVLTEAEMEARCRAWAEREARMGRIRSLRPDVALDPMIAGEREAAIAHHERVIAELTRFALTGVR